MQENSETTLPVTLLGHDAVLREQATDVAEGTDMKQLAQQMRESMRVNDGIGIAAPQIGKSIRMFVVAKELFPTDIQSALSTDTFINPSLKTRGFKRETLEEGCLSIPRVFGDVSRHARVKLEAYDLDWNRIHMAADGLLARVFQHEMDHLNGTLFVDRADTRTLHKIEQDDSLRAWNIEEVEPGT